MNKYYIVCYKDGQFLPIVIENNKTIRTEEDIKAITEEYGVVISIINLKEWVVVTIKHCIDKPCFVEHYRFMLSMKLTVTVMRHLKDWEINFMLERARELRIHDMRAFIHWVLYEVKYEPRTRICTTLEPYKAYNDRQVIILEGV